MRSTRGEPGAPLVGPSGTHPTPADGHGVVSTWTDGMHGCHPGGVPQVLDHGTSPGRALRAATAEAARAARTAGGDTGVEAGKRGDRRPGADHPLGAPRTLERLVDVSRRGERAP